MSRTFLSCSAYAVSGASTTRICPRKSFTEAMSGCTKSSFRLLSPPRTMTTSCFARSTIATALSTAACAIWNSPFARPSRCSCESRVNRISTASPCFAK